MSGITFYQIPSDIRTPGYYMEFDSSLALSGMLGIHQKILLIGQRLSTGEAPVGELVRVLRTDGAETDFGRGSMLAEMCKAAKAVNAYSEMWAVALDDHASGVAATKTVTIAGAATAAGVLYLMIAGQAVPCAVANEDSATEVAANAVTVINATTDLPVTAASAEGVVTLTARHKGECGQSIDVRINHYQGERTPAGLTVTIANETTGEQNPDITAALAALSDQQFDYIALPYLDVTNLAALETELETRWGPLQPIDGLAFGAVSGTFGEMTTFGASRNSKHVSVLAVGKMPSPPWVAAACYAAKAGYDLNVDPALPLATEVLTGLVPARIQDRLNQSERNTLLHTGLSTVEVDSGGRVLIERAITMYQKNADGLDDPSYLNVNTIASLSAYRVQLRTHMSNRFSRHKLADDTANVQAGQKITRPKDIASEIIAHYMTMQDAGLVEDLETFKANLVVERNAADRGRVDVLLTPKLVGQFRVLAIQTQFIL